LVVNNQNLIDIHSEDSRDFPFYGNPKEIEVEIKEVQLLLQKTTPPTVSSLGVAPSTEASSSGVPNVKENKPWLLKKNGNSNAPIRKDNTFIKASYGHSAERVKEIIEDNNRLVKRLVGKANAPPSTFIISAANHDKVSKNTGKC
jgi:hypothetical protein